MFDQSLISPVSNLLLLGGLCLSAAFGLWVDTTRIGRNVSGAAGILTLSMALSNLGVMPRAAEVYGVVWGYLVPLSIPLLLLKADLRRILAETQGMLGAFILGTIGTTIGVVFGFFLLPLGEEAAKLAGVFSATYIGGSMNMAAVTQAVNLTPDLAAASIAADNVIGVIYLSLLALMPSLLFMRRFFREEAVEEIATTDGGGAAEKPKLPEIDLSHIGLALGLAFVICATGEFLAGLVGLSGYSIMFVTGLTLLVANLFPHRLTHLKGDYEVGLLFMYIFFATIGLSADIAALLDKAVVVALYASVIVAFHAVVIFVGSRSFGLPLMEVVIASNACASGPASAAALAAGKGRVDLVGPGVLLGVFGYAVANFIGLSLAVLFGS
ncbi:DUF819 domain-containing protein [Emcibacter nanhaiensis]|uniref:DUF819 family protein n=1 Tax=Emcibacter nanhaiensis TaxID=1505037 RepID=A0A501PD59_9PROT|nr:DUF819 family protein [Emcibacter nanhaiensis]TPD57937.1 DUF819 family protein [Emcibacter nanhaiensis]